MFYRPQSSIFSSLNKRLHTSILSLSYFRSPLTSVAADIETKNVCNEIIRLGNVSNVATHFSRNQMRYSVLNHIAALNQITLLDMNHQEKDSALVHMALIEKFIKPYLSILGPRDIANVLYCFAVYNRTIPTNLHASISGRLSKAIPLMKELLPGGPIWQGYRPSTLANFTDIPQVCFSAIHGTNSIDQIQDIPMAAWTFAKHNLFASIIFDSIRDEFISLVSVTNEKSLTLINDSILRLCWAFGKYGQIEPLLGQTLTGMINPRINWTFEAKMPNPDALNVQQFNFSQLVLLSWCFAQGNHFDEVSTRLIHHVFQTDHLELLKSSLPLGTLQQLYQISILLHKNTAFTNLPSIPKWIVSKLNSSDSQRVPSEIDQYDFLYKSISILLSQLRLNHSRQYNVDGYCIDIAFPSSRFGIEIINKEIKTLHHHGGENLHNAENNIPSYKNKLRYLATRGWNIVELDYIQWKRSPQQNRIQLLVDICRGRNNTFNSA
jgi:hypothetical protein